jgi:hypothetical protein
MIRTFTITLLVSAFFATACTFGVFDRYYASGGADAGGTANADATPGSSDAGADTTLTQGDATLTQGDATQSDATVLLGKACPFNLLKNGDFENGTINSWLVDYYGTKEGTPEAARTGQAGARLCMLNTSFDMAYFSQDLTGRVPAIATGDYHFHVWARSDSRFAGKTVRVGLETNNTRNSALSQAWDCKEINLQQIRPPNADVIVATENLKGCIDIDDAVLVRLPEDGGTLPPECLCP